MATYTPNYGLHQWESSDDFLRTDFNQDLSKIDTAIKEAKDLADGKISCVTGEYTGNGSTGTSGGVWLTFPFVPKLVIIQPVVVNYTGGASTLILQSPHIQFFLGSTYEDVKAEWEGNSLHFYGDTGSGATTFLNGNNCTYAYSAFG